jgi:hypothetical protein
MATQAKPVAASPAAPDRRRIKRSIPQPSSRVTVHYLSFPAKRTNPGLDEITNRGNHEYL